jgi:hypothetical protein
MKKNYQFCFLISFFRLIKRTIMPLATQVPNLCDCLLTRGIDRKQPKIDS